MRAIALVALLLPLSACDTRLTLQQVCESHPEMCQDVPLTGWCTKERSQVIWTRYEDQPNDRRTIYNELISLENYVGCMEKATMIENRIIAKERETARIESYIASQKALKKLQQSTASSPSPYLSFYHWTRLNDHQALARFLESERKGELSSVQLKQFAASYYSRINPEKAVAYLLDTLTTLPHPAIDTYLDLSNEYLTLNQPANAYLFAKMTAQFKPELVNAQRLRLLRASSNVDKATLDAKAEVLLDKLEQGTFTANDLKL